MLACFLTPVWTAPALQVAEPALNYGNRRSGDIIRHTFRIENTGTETLKISGIRSSCGCTSPQKDGIRILPGETGELPVRINLRGRTGPQSQRIRFYSNDPRHPTYTLKLDGVATPDISVEPRTLNMGMVNPDQPAPGTVVLRSTRKRPFDVINVRTQRKRLNVKVVTSEDRLTTELQVTPNSVKGQGQFTDVILLETADPEKKEERILVMWQISHGVSVAPSELHMAVSPQLQMLNRYLMVKDYPGIKEPLEVLNVEWPGHEEVEVLIQDTKRFGWRVHIKNFTPTREMDGSELVITTNAEGHETLRVPVKVIE